MSFLLPSQDQFAMTHPSSPSMIHQVTLQSFLWSPRLASEGTQEQVQQLVLEQLGCLQAAPAVALEDVTRVTPAQVAALNRRVTSGTSGEVTASVKGVLIGKVRQWWT
jgi:hypothetical protein